VARSYYVWRLGLESLLLWALNKSATKPGKNPSTNGIYQN
jgi:hypothetical protein